MHKLIRKGQFGFSIGNIGVENLKLETPKIELPRSFLGTLTLNDGPSLNLTDGLSFFGNEGLSSTLSSAGSYLGAKYGGELLKKGTSKLLGLAGGSLLGNLFKSTGGASGLVSLGASIGESLLPKRITSKSTDAINGVLGIASNVPGPIGLYATAAKFGFNAIDSLGASRLATLNKNQDSEDALARTGGGYGDAVSAWDRASSISGKRAGLFSNKSSLNNKIYNANRLMSVLSQIMGLQKDNETLIALMGDRWNERTMRDLNGGFGNISFGRLGLKIEILDKVHSILNAPKVLDTLTELEDEVPEFKEGGKMNVIPEGSLHARLHHMENAEGLTKKGIPVVSEMEGGELEQQAEIELNEIIFTLEVTQELEKLMEDGSDNAAIEAGKLLVKEIFENTDDRTGLLKLLEPEKKEPTTENIVKNHQVFQEGGKL